MKEILSQLFSLPFAPHNNATKPRRRNGIYQLRGSSQLNLIPVRPDIHYHGTVGDLLITRPKMQEIDPFAMMLGLAPSRIVKAFRINKKLKKSVSLHRLLPKIVKTHNNMYSSTMGPNCWNATMNWFVPSTGVHHTRDVWMVKWLEKETKSLKEKELQLGDIIAFWNGSTLEHTVVYLNNQYVWHKGGSSADRPWTYESFDSVVKAYCGSLLCKITFHRFAGVQ